MIKKNFGKICGRNIFFLEAEKERKRLLGLLLIIKCSSLQPPGMPIHSINVSGGQALQLCGAVESAASQIHTFSLLFFHFDSELILSLFTAQ